MRIFCCWCQAWLTGRDVCEVLPAGCLWPIGASVCTSCCPHAHHGIALGEQRGG